MARPRKPTNVLALHGAFDKNPSRGRERANEPEPEGEIGDPYEEMAESDKACWRELVRMCHAGVLSAADRPFMRYAARVAAIVWGSPELDPKWGLRFESVCGRLGMTPADRSKVAVIKPKIDANPYAKFKRST